METNNLFLMFIGAISLLGVYLNIAEILSLGANSSEENTPIVLANNRSSRSTGETYSNTTLIRSASEAIIPEVPEYLRNHTLLESQLGGNNISKSKSRASTGFSESNLIESLESKPEIRLLSGYLVPAESENSSLETSNSVVEFFHP